MEENKKWIEELRELIIEEDDKILFDESSGCFLTNHLRASYILSWISIIESLKRKINLFSNLGDSRATEAVKEIEKYEQQKNSTDRLIFDEANRCGIIDNPASSTINYLWEQRCLFAHPYNIQPEIDEVKYIIGQSIKLVLGKELLYNKDFLTEISINISTKPFFLPIEIERIREFASKTISRTPQELHPFFFKTLLYYVGQLANIPEKVNELRKLRYFLIELFSTTQIPLNEQVWSLENRVTKFPYESYIGFVHQETWLKLPVRIKEMLVAYLLKEPDLNKLRNLKTITSNLIEANVFEHNFEQDYVILLNNTKFDSAINYYGRIDTKFERIKNELESWQYEKQNIVIDFIQEENGIKFINTLDSVKQIYLGRLLRACATNGHWKTQHLISNIVNGSLNVSDDIKGGIAFSSIITWRNDYKLDIEFIFKAIKILNEIDEEKQNNIYNEILKILNTNKPDEFDKMTFNEMVLESTAISVNESITNWVQTNKTNFEVLIEEIKKYFA